MKKLFLLLLFPTIFLSNSYAESARKSLFGFDGFLLGAFVNKEWVDAGDLQEDEKFHKYRYWGGEEGKIYNFLGLDEKTSEGTILADAFNGRFHTLYVQTMSEKGVISLANGDAKLIINSDFDAIPRKAEIISNENPSYQKIVADYLEKKGIKAEPKIMQVFLIDLEGDGIKEVLINAQNLVSSQDEDFNFAINKPLLKRLHIPTGLPFEVRKNQYSLVLLKKVENGEDKILSLAEFLPQDDFKIENPFQPKQAQLYKISSIADLNGDGVLEIVMTQAFNFCFNYLVLDKEGKEILGNGICYD